jgi:hypothetical protein
MKPAEMFGVMVRTIGLLVTMGALFLISVITMELIFKGLGVVEGYLLGLLGMFIGLYFLSGAELLVKAVYPKEP